MYGEYFKLTPEQRALDQRLMLANAIATVRKYYPTAMSFDLASSDQRRSGFLLTGVTLTNGTQAEYPYADGFEGEMEEHLDDLDWNGVVGEDRGGYATIGINDAVILAMAAEIKASTEKLLLNTTPPPGGNVMQQLVEVIVVRDPDSENRFAVFINGERVDDSHENAAVKVVLWDLDLGADEIDREWVDDNLDTVGVLTTYADKYVQNTVLAVAQSNNIDMRDQDDDQDDDEKETAARS